MIILLVIKYKNKVYLIYYFVRRYNLFVINRYELKYLMNFFVFIVYKRILCWKFFLLFRRCKMNVYNIFCYLLLIFLFLLFLMLDFVWSCRCFFFYF